MDSELAGSLPQCQSRWLKWFQAWKLQTPGCVLHDIGSQDGVDYLVMGCMEGETLAKRLEKGPLPLEHVLRYGAQIADALDKAPRAGIVHRDLKPGNIVLTPTGSIWRNKGLRQIEATAHSFGQTTFLALSR